MKAPEQYRKRELPEYGPIRCNVCGRADHIDFHVPDDVWEKVVPREFRDCAICLPCFDNFASARNVKYMKFLNDEIYFAGNMGTFIARIMTRTDVQTCD